MQDKKKFITIFIVICLIIAGGIMAAIALSSPTTVGTGKDSISGTIGIGDYYEVNMVADTDSSHNDYMMKDSYYGWLFDETGTDDPLHPKSITVNGVEVICHTYYTTYTVGGVDYLKLVFVDVNKHRSYGYELYANDVLKDCRYLVSTSFSLDTEYADLEMTKNTKIKYTTDVAIAATICPAISLIMKSTVTETVGDFVIERGGYTIVVEQHTEGNQDARATVADYISNADGQTVMTTDGKILPKYEYMMAIDYDDFGTYVRRSEASTAYEPAISKTIDTVYGKRNVTEQVVTVFGDIDSKYTIDYGPNNVIYSIKEQKLTQTGYVDITIISSSLIHEDTKKIYADPIKISNTTVLFSIAITLMCTLAALIAAILLYKYVIRREVKIKFGRSKHGR